MLFPQRLDFLDAKADKALGGSYSFSITREFHIETILLLVDATIATGMATANADALQNLIKRVVVTVADGARTRNVVDMSGPALLEYWQNVNGQLDKDTSTNIGTNPTGTKRLVYPIPFALPNVDDPFGSMMMLPAPRYTSDIQLKIDIASQADMDTNATPTFAITGNVTIRPLIIRRSVLVANWPTFDTELAELSVAYSSSGANQAYELQSPGSYTGILLRCYTSATARGDVSTTNGEFKLQLLGTNIRRFRLLDIEAINYYSRNPVVGAVGTVPAGCYFLDFLTDKPGLSAGEFGSVLDANLPVTTGARLRLIQDIAGAANVKINYVTHRVFGILDNLKMLTRLGKKGKAV